MPYRTWQARLTSAGIAGKKDGSRLSASTGQSAGPGQSANGTPGAGRATERGQEPADERALAPFPGDARQRDAEAGQRRSPIGAAGAAAAMFVLFLAGNLAAGRLHVGVLTGLSFLTGSVAVAWAAHRRDLLLVVTLPPMIFLLTVLCAQAATASGSTLKTSAESVAAGTILTLSAAAPWLFGGLLLALVLAMRRGLAQSVRDLRADLRRNNAPGSFR